MTSIADRLASIGVRLRDGEDPATRAELVRIARLLQRRGCRRLGLIPAGDEVALPAVALQVGLALVQLTGTPTGVIDAQRSWPGAAAIASAGQNASSFAADWITDKLVLLTPLTSLYPAAQLLDLEAFHPAVEHLVFDLTGLDASGEHLEAMAVLDAIAVVARAGRTTVPQLDRRVREIPAERNLGVLLIGKE